MLIDNYSPSNNLIQTNQGVLNYFDNIRGSWLSVHRSIFSFGLNHSDISGKRFMSLMSDMTSNNSSYVCFRNGVITAISANCKENANASFKIIKNNDANNELYSLDLSDDSVKSIDNLNVNFLSHDIIQCIIEVNPSSFIDYPFITIEVAWA